MLIRQVCYATYQLFSIRMCKDLLKGDICCRPVAQPDQNLRVCSWTTL